MLNLGRSSIKLTTEGFLRFRVVVNDGLVEVHVEDSGPGIPRDKRSTLFSGVQSRINISGQGTGIGLSLCNKLMKLMNGFIYLDEDYNSGIPGHPGAKFIVKL